MVRKRRLGCIILGFLCILIGSLGLENEKNDFLAPVQSNCGGTVSRESPKWIVHGGFILLLLCIISTFWGLTVITETYCLPAIFFFCKRNKIPDDVAGSLFIGTGLSLPILFSSYVGLFASKSNIGVGTVLGGNILNLTLNIAGSILVAPNRRLKLHNVTLTREIIFSATSNILIILCLHQDFGESFKNLLSTNWSQCLSVPWQYSLLLISGYLFYCMVVSLPYFLATFQRSTYCVLPMENFETAAENSHNFASTEGIVCAEPISQIGNLKSNSWTTRNAISSLFNTGNNSRKVTDVSMTNDNDAPHGLRDHEDGGVLDFILFKKNKFYSCFNLYDEVWESRYCHIDSNGTMSYRLKKEQPLRGLHVAFVDLLYKDCLIIKDRSAYKFDIIANYPNKRRFTFKAPDSSTFTLVINRLTRIIESTKDKSTTELRTMAEDSMNRINWKIPLCSDSATDYGNEDLEIRSCAAIELFVLPNGIVSKALYFVLHPMRYMIFYSTPDTRLKGNEHKAIRCILICILWMAIQTYLLITSLNEIGDLIHVNGSIMGLTFASIAASYPAFMSSIVLARDGYGDAAITNAMGSNVFNNFIGLGLPWLTYSLSHNNEEYGGMQDGGIVLALVVLTAILILFYILLACSDFVLQYWLVPLLCLAYVAYITFLCYYSTLV